MDSELYSVSLKIIFRLSHVKIKPSRFSWACWRGHPSADSHKIKLSWLHIQQNANNIGSSPRILTLHSSKITRKPPKNSSKVWVFTLPKVWIIEFYRFMGF
jgi:hypothetical protein